MHHCTPVMAIAALSAILQAPLTSEAAGQNKLEVFFWWTSGGEAAALNGQCCKFVVEAKICVDDRQFSSTPRTERMKRCGRPIFAPAALLYAWPLRII